MIRFFEKSDFDRPKQGSDSTAAEKKIEVCAKIPDLSFFFSTCRIQLNFCCRNDDDDDDDNDVNEVDDVDNDDDHLN